MRKRLRARCEKGGWVRFPRNLRIEGAIYLVEELHSSKRLSWITIGEIRLIYLPELGQFEQGFRKLRDGVSDDYRNAELLSKMDPFDLFIKQPTKVSLDFHA